MTLTPNAIPFFSCSPIISHNQRDLFLQVAQFSLSRFDFQLLCDILSEWESSPLIYECFDKWKPFANVGFTGQIDSLQVLSFNVRGLDLQMQDVLLLSNSFNFDIIILLETDYFHQKHCKGLFPKYRLFSQEGENSNGGVAILTRLGLYVKRVECRTSNMCAIDLFDDASFRIIGVYAPNSKKWKWDDLSSLVSTKCAFFGDYNVDFEEDKAKTEILLSWADSHGLPPYTPSMATSKRSNRIIDYVFTSGFSVPIQTYEDSTASDHRPIISTIPVKAKETSYARNIHWKVFVLFSDYVFPFWERHWSLERIDNTYQQYTTFLSLLSARCTVLFPLNKY